MTKRRALALAILALAGLAVAAFALTRAEQVNVPNVLGESEAQATAILERQGFDVRPLTVESCAERGTVFEQQPAAGARADEGSEVRIDVSLGLEVRVPAVRGQRLPRARERIEEEDLLVDTRNRSSGEIAAGRVIRTVPPVGDPVDCEAVVTLVVSTGPELVELPSLIGLQRSAAVAQLERLDLIPNTDRVDADQASGEVIGQDPGPGSTLEPGTVVTITVSTGRGSVIVPGVEGRSLDAARQALSERNLSVSIIREDTDVRRDDDRVLEQSPSAGQRVRAGEAVTIVVGRFVEPPPEPPEEQGAP